MNQSAHSARVAIKAGDVRGFCWLYRADSRTTDMLARWALATRAEGWWEDFDDAVPSQDGLYLGLEGQARHLHVYEPALVPVLLQTPDYTQAVNPGSPRLKRQLELTPALRLTVVLGEGVLTRPVGGTDVMHEQVRRLQDLADQMHIDIRYLPRHADAHPAMRTGAFTILDLASDCDPAVVYVKTLTGARYLERPTEIAEHRRVLADLYGRSLPISSYRCWFRSASGSGTASGSDSMLLPVPEPEPGPSTLPVLRGNGSGNGRC